MRDAFEQYGGGAFRLDRLHTDATAVGGSRTAVDSCVAMGAGEGGPPAAERGTQPRWGEGEGGPPADASSPVRPPWQYTGGSSPRSDRSRAAAAAAALNGASKAATPLQGGELAGAGEGEAEAVGMPIWRGEWAARGWLAANPVGAPTEREVFMDSVTGGRVYRLYLERVL